MKIKNTYTAATSAGINQKKTKVSCGIIVFKRVKVNWKDMYYLLLCEK